LLAGLLLPCQAQWITQRIQLKPGWNAVCLQVQPAESRCDDAFAGLEAIESVWKYNRVFSTVEYDKNPAVLLPTADHWLTWLPRSHPESFLSTLHALQGGQAYLIKVSARSAPIVWSVKGLPALSRARWMPDAMNLVGLPIDPAAKPSFAQLFADTPEVESGPGIGSGIYGLDEDGMEYQIRQTYRTLVELQTAYWIRLRQFARSSLPLDVEGEFAASGMLSFGRERQETSLTFRNHAAGKSITLLLRLVASEAAPPGWPELAGRVPLAHFVSDPASSQYGWQTFPAQLELSLAPGEAKELRLGVVRGEMTPYVPLGTNGAVYASLLEVRETPHSIRMLVPITAENERVFQSRPVSLTSVGMKAAPMLAELPLYHLSQGLWVGQVQLTDVSQPRYGDNVQGMDPNPLLPVGAPLNTRLILHVDAKGICRLLQRVMLVYEAGATNAAYRLFADEAGVPTAAEEVYRVSCATLRLSPPLPLSGQFGDVLQTRVDLDYDDPVNPFKHRYHPDHDNLDDLFSTNKLRAGIESFSVAREVSLDFSVTHKTADGKYAPPAAVLKFSGQNSYLQVDPVTLGSAVTLMAWVRVEAPAARDQYLFCLGNDSQETIYVKLDAGAGTMTFGCASGGQSSVLVTTNAFPSNQWTHVTVINDGTSRASGRIYWNAQLVAEEDFLVLNPRSWTNVFLGRGLAADSGYLTGSLYDVVFWGDVRTDEEVQEDMFLSGTGAEDNVLAYFKANEGAGTVLSDITGGPLKAYLHNLAWDESQAFRSTFWGIGEAEGQYSETILGLRPQPIRVRGTFRLERVSRESELN
jgi:hypothetical protein